MRIKSLNSNDLFALSSYGFEAPFIELMHRAKEIGGLHSELHKKSVLFRKSRYTYVSQQFAAVSQQFAADKKSYLQSAKSYLFQVDKDLTLLPAKFLAYPVPKSYLRNILLQLSRNVSIKEVLELIKNPDQGNTSLRNKLEKSPDWINQINQAVCFHNFIYKRYDDNFCSREDERLSFIFKKDDSFTLAQNKMNYLLNYNVERHKINRVLMDFEFAKDLTLDAIHKVKFNKNERDTLYDKLNKFLKINGIYKNNIDFVNNSLELKYGSLSIFCLFSVITSKTTKKKLEALHYAGIRNINSLSLLLIWDFLAKKDVLKFLKSNDTDIYKKNSYTPRAEIPYTTRGMNLSSDISLYDDLIKLRWAIAKEFSLPIHFVYSNQTAKDIWKYKPKNIDELLNIKGMGKNKVDKFGDMIIHQVIKASN